MKGQGGVKIEVHMVNQQPTLEPLRQRPIYGCPNCGHPLGENGQCRRCLTWARPPGLRVIGHA